MKFTLWQLFSIVDGRLSTEIKDVYAILNYICNDNLFTHHLQVAMDYLHKTNPAWFAKLCKKINTIVDKETTIKERTQEQFEQISQIEKLKKLTFRVPQLENFVEFEKYMMDNSLLRGKDVTIVTI